MMIWCVSVKCKKRPFSPRFLTAARNEIYLIFILFTVKFEFWLMIATVGITILFASQRHGWEINLMGSKNMYNNFWWVYLTFRVKNVVVCDASAAVGRRRCKGHILTEKELFQVHLSDRASRRRLECGQKVLPRHVARRFQRKLWTFHVFLCVSLDLPSSSWFTTSCLFFTAFPSLIPLSFAVLLCSAISTTEINRSFLDAVALSHVSVVVWLLSGGWGKRNSAKRQNECN